MTDAALLRRLERRAERERTARLQAEAIAEQATRELYGEVRRSNAILEATTDLVIVVDARTHQCLYLNAAAGKLLDLEVGIALDEGALRRLFPQEALQQGEVWRGEVSVTLWDGTELPVSLVALAHRGLDGELEYYAGIARDISERKAFEAQLTHQATHDALTGLPNRTLFLDRLGEALERSSRTGDAVAVLFFDLDRFKLINDSLGHWAGDELLCAVAERLQPTLRGDSTLARFGGDEFAVLCERLTDVEAARRIAGRVQQACAAPFLLGDRDVFVTLSMGIAVAAGHHDGSVALLRDADTAMHRAKQRGGARFELFDEGLRVATLERMTLEHDLHRALERGELELRYQPCVRMADGAIVGVEALLRWRHPERGLVSPLEFIGVAEETGLIVPMGEWVLGEACRQVAQWRRVHPAAASLEVAVNLSARQLHQPELQGTVLRALLGSALDPGALCLELTETVLMERTDATAATLAGLRDLGVRLAIDDFGTGYSSLDYLRRFPVDVLKVDRSFVESLGQDLGAEAIATAIIRICEALDLRTVAEGVETAQQRDALLALGCRLAQGYFFAPPLEADEIGLRLAGASDRMYLTDGTAHLVPHGTEHAGESAGLQHDAARPEPTAARPVGGPPAAPCGPSRAGRAWS